MNISVIIPTWKRERLLKKTIKSLNNQTRLANEIIIIYRDIDNVTKDYLQKNLTNITPYKMIEVNKPGVIFAENTGISHAKGEIIAFLDDDAEAPLNWLEIIEKHFLSNSSIGAVGGPDFITQHHNSNYRKFTNKIGHLSFYGKVSGNHHHLSNSILQVDVLKGVNMAIKKDCLIKLDPNLQSSFSEGNGSHWELDLCFNVKKKGYILIFDPQIDVTHHSNHKHFIHSKNLRNSSRNLTYILLKNFNLFNKAFYILYIIFIGNSQNIGFLKYLHLCYNFGITTASKDYFYSNTGFLDGLKLYLKKDRNIKNG